MKNPANPGDFGTNGTRGVVLSGMSETTKSADAEWEAERRSGAQVIADQLRKYSNLKIQHPLRPSTFGAEGGAERETTNSPAEIGAGCTGRKMASARVALCATMIAFLLVCIWNIGGAWSAFGAIGLAVWVNLFRLECASGGEGV